MSREIKVYDLLKAAISTYGAEAQEQVAMEECAELIQAISHKHRGRPHNIAEEIADVDIMLAQLRIINNCEDEVSRYIDEKLRRLIRRLTDEL